MSKGLRFSIAFGLFATALACFMLVIDTANSQEAPKKKLPDAKLDLDQSTFMRKKLEASTQILEGLTTENAALIIEGARILVDMSSAEKWKVQHDAMYRQFSSEFQRSATGLLEAAEKSNFDAAALKWIDSTMKCMECHRFVRGTRVVDNNR